MTNLITQVRQVISAYNSGDPEPLIATFAPGVSYTIVDLDKTYTGREAVTALARQGAGQTKFHLQDVICHGNLVSYTYEHENPLADIAYHGEGLAVMKFDDDGKLLGQWAYRK